MLIDFIYYGGGGQIQASLPDNQYKIKTMTCPSFILQM